MGICLMGKKGHPGIPGFFRLTRIYDVGNGCDGFQRIRNTPSNFPSLIRFNPPNPRQVNLDAGQEPRRLLE